MTFHISLGASIRKSVFFDATVADGAKSFTVYNHMYMPAHFGDPASEYEKLIHDVAMWDVAAQRQVEIAGPDAETLVRYLTTRDLGQVIPGVGRYVPLCNYEGSLINDPVLLPIEADRFWFSIADSDIELWSQAIAREKGLDVRISEPDASPLAIQGPKAFRLAEALFGSWTRDLRYFHFREAKLDGIPLLVARSGWSKQGGFELYLLDHTRGTELYAKVKEAGRPFGIGPGAPGDQERIESGLLSYGTDCRHLNHPANPFELGLGKLVGLDRADDFVGKRALRRILADGVKRRRTGFIVEGPAVTANQEAIPILSLGQEVGYISEMVWSTRLTQNIATGIIGNQVEDEASDLAIMFNGEVRSLTIAALPFI
ncbi:glycine cleavage T C-terminal barrel domain-containing protein [Mesorhizobium sp.]|uniref:glycine cleavage T C-terminal barrel domain-containing protein n=1 Tax=Mesorhizobium sp. TaxID=1871066 RepID=UPI0025D91500|nr:glycine cleavage T C-terminal barrel domain-containing protein [Mesorhizobium sp.]